MPRLPAEWPGWVSGYQRRPDPHHSRQRRPPQGIVVHSGNVGADLADAALRMPISYHLAWDVVPGELDRFVQLVSLQRRAWHAGSEGNHWIGIALSGPWDQDQRSDYERECFLALAGTLEEAFGGWLRWWCCHSDITPGKTDPGPGFDASWFQGTGLVWRRAS